MEKEEALRTECNENKSTIAEREATIETLRAELEAARNTTEEQTQGLMEKEEALRTECNENKSTRPRAARPRSRPRVMEKGNRVQRQVDHCGKTLRAARGRAQHGRGADPGSDGEGGGAAHRVQREQVDHCGKEATIETLRAELEAARSTTEEQTQGLMEKEEALRTECNENKSTIAEREATIETLRAELEAARSTARSRPRV